MRLRQRHARSAAAAGLIGAIAGCPCNAQPLVRGDPVVLAETPYVAVTTCADQVLRIGGYLVLCNDHSHPYHYGPAVLISETWIDKGKPSTFYKLCLVGGDESCRLVQLLRR